MGWRQTHRKGNHVGEPIHRKQRVIITAHPFQRSKSDDPRAQWRASLDAWSLWRSPCRLLISWPMCMISPRPSGADGCNVRCSWFLGPNPETHTLLIDPTFDAAGIKSIRSASRKCQRRIQSSHLLTSSEWACVSFRGGEKEESKKYLWSYFEPVFAC